MKDMNTSNVTITNINNTITTLEEVHIKIGHNSNIHLFRNQIKPNKDGTWNTGEKEWLIIYKEMIRQSF